MAAPPAKKQLPPATLSPELLEMRLRYDVRLSDLRTDRTGFEYDWVDIAHHICPHRGRFIVPLTPRRPRRSGHKIIDPTATKAHQKLASFLMAGITNPQLNWFRLGIGDDKAAAMPDVKAWLGECQKRMMRVLASGTFYTSMHQVYEELGGFATGAMLCLQDFHDVVRFYPLTTGEYWCALNNRQEIDVLYREYSLTIAQLVKEFGYENCSTTVQNLYDQRRLNGLMVVIHAIEPNLAQRPGAAGWRGKGYISAYYERGINGTFLRLEGFSHQPFIAPRWSALAGDAYGQGPGHWALPDVKSLQMGARQMSEAAEKLVNPPLQGDARYQNAYLGMLPGDVNWIGGLDQAAHAGLRPIFQVPPNVQVLQTEVQQFRATIEATFFNDLIMAISQMEGVQPRNELEITERRQEKMLMLGPMLERFYSEALAPVIRIVFDIMQRGHLLPPPPAALHGLQIEPEFVSVLAQAQRSVGTTSLEQFLKFVGSMAGVWQGVIEKVDADKVVERYADELEIPADLLVSDQVVQAQRKQAQQQAQMQQLLQATPALAQGAKNLGSTDVGGGRSALQAISGQ